MQKIGWFLFILFILYFIFLIRQDIIDNQEFKREQALISQSIRQEEAQGKKLEERNRALGRPELVEELARQRLGLIKKGETPYKVVPRWWNW